MEEKEKNQREQQVCKRKRENGPLSFFLAGCRGKK